MYMEARPGPGLIVGKRIQGLTEISNGRKNCFDKFALSIMDNPNSFAEIKGTVLQQFCSICNLFATALLFFIPQTFRFSTLPNLVNLIQMQTKLAVAISRYNHFPVTTFT